MMLYNDPTIIGGITKELYPEIADKYNCTWYRIGNTTKAGHPRHPLFVSKIEKEMKDFDVHMYLDVLETNLNKNKYPIEYKLDKDLLRLLSEANLKYGEYKTMLHTLEFDARYFLDSVLLTESYKSTQIEGTQISQDEMYYLKYMM